MKCISQMFITEISNEDESSPSVEMTIPRKHSKSYTICLNMIVKNESHIIVKTLENLCSYVDFDAYFSSVFNSCLLVSK
jgi:hypothetical protein